MTYKDKILQGDSLTILKTLDSESVDMCITSPPYWGLRDYGTTKWEDGDPKCNHQRDNKSGNAATGHRAMAEKGQAVGDAIYKDICKKCGAKRIDLQIGLEKTFDQYIDNLIGIFNEVKRILKKDGTCWVNIGDTYNGSWGATSHKLNGKAKKYGYNHRPPQSYKSKVKNKSLHMIPERFAISMIDQGWILRNVIIWHKPACMPSSVKDRFTVDFEYLYFFVKNKKYYFEQQFEPHNVDSIERYKSNFKILPKAWDGKNCPISGGRKANYKFSEKGRNKRTVWSINTEAFSEAHFAVYPPALIETPIKAGSAPGGIVLDPFMGSGTTALVSKKLGRHYTGIELNPEYIKIADKRLEEVALLNII